MAHREPAMRHRVERFAHLLIGTLLTLVVFALVWRTFHELNDPINGQDEAIVLLYTDRLLAGDFAYFSYESVYPFGLGALLALPVALLQDDLLLIRLLPFALAVLMVSLLILRTRRTLPALVLLVVLLGTWPEGALFWQYAVLLFGISLQLLLFPKPFIQGMGAFLLVCVLSVRLDFALVVAPIVVAHIFSMWRGGLTPGRKAILLGYVIGSVPLLFQVGLLVVQPGFFNWLHIQQTIGKGRILPLDLATSLTTVFALIGGVATMTLTAIFMYRRKRRIPLFVVLAIGGAGTLAVFQALRRFDSVHLYYALGLCAIAIAGASTNHKRYRSFPLVTVLGALVLLIPHISVLQVATQFFRQLPTIDFATTDRESRSLCTNSRCIEVEPRLADWYDEPLKLVSANDSSSVFIGPSDLRTANYSDDWAYLLLDNPVCSRFLEMNPGSSNRSDSGLEDDLADCDYLVLTALYNMPIENEWARDEFARSRHNDALSRFDLVYSNDVVFVYRNRNI